MRASSLRTFGTLGTLAVLALASAAVAASAVACGSGDRPSPAMLFSAPPDAGGAAGGGLLPGDSDDFGGGEVCAVETKLVYVVSAEEDLYSFDPTKLQFLKIGKLACPDSVGTPYSMAVDRSGVAWVLYDDGHIFQVDTRNAKCRSTEFEPNQHGFGTFGMGFSSNTADSADEKLFVSQGRADAPPRGLATIDTTTLQLALIADYDQLAGRGVELTGTGDARLFGAFEGSPFVVAEIDKSSAKILSQAPQPGVSSPDDAGAGMVLGSNFAFAFWGGDFWLFVGPGGATDVFQYSPSTGTTSKKGTVTFEIVGAGVSTCAPIAPPK